MQGGSSGFTRSLPLETYRIANGLISERDNIFRLGDDKASIEANYAIEKY